MLSIQTGAGFISKGTKYIYSSEKEESYFYSEDVIDYLEIPVNLIANFKANNHKIFVGMRTYESFNLDAKRIDRYPAGNNNLPKNTNEKNSYVPYQGTDFGLNFFTGYRLYNGLNIQMSYTLGLTNISASKVYRTYHRTLLLIYL